MPTRVELRTVESTPLIAAGATLDHFVCEQATPFAVMVFRSDDGDGPEARERMNRLRVMWRAQGLPRSLLVALPPHVGVEVYEGTALASVPDASAAGASGPETLIELQGTYQRFAASVAEPGCCGCPGREDVVRCACGCGLVAPFGSESTMHFDGHHWRIHHLLEYALRVAALGGAARLEPAAAAPEAPKP